MVKTLASHAGIKGSIPLRVTIYFCADVAQQAEHFLGKEEVGSSNLLISSIKVPLKKEMKNMKDGKIPNPNTIYPIAGYDKEIYVKPTITNKNIFCFSSPPDPDLQSHSVRGEAPPNSIVSSPPSRPATTPPNSIGSLSTSHLTATPAIAIPAIATTAIAKSPAKKIRCTSESLFGCASLLTLRIFGIFRI